MLSALCRTFACASAVATWRLGDLDRVMERVSAQGGIVEHEEALQLLLRCHRNLAEPAAQLRRRKVAAVGPVEELVEVVVRFRDCRAWVFLKVVPTF